MKIITSSLNFTYVCCVTKFVHDRLVFCHGNYGYAQIYSQGINVEKSEKCQNTHDVSPSLPDHPYWVIFNAAIRMTINDNEFQTHHRLQ